MVNFFLAVNNLTVEFSAVFLLEELKFVCPSSKGSKFQLIRGGITIEIFPPFRAGERKISMSVCCYLVLKISPNLMFVVF